MFTKLYHRAKALLRLILGGIFSGAGYILGYHPKSPTLVFLALLAVVGFTAQLAWGDQWLVRGGNQDPFGGPEFSEDANAPLLPITGSVQAASAVQTGNPLLDTSTYRSIESGSVPEEFSGYFFVFDDTVRGHTNPARQALLPLVERTGFLTYTVESGDSAASIAERFGISLDTILWANNLNRGSILKPGQTLTILPVSGVVHRVSSGETLGEISRRYQVNINAIMAVNSLSGEDTIAAGMQIVIPGGRPSTSQAIASAPARLTTSTRTAGYFRAPTVGLNWGRRHNYNAVDIANACGTPIFAAQEGSIKSASQGNWNRGYGNLIQILHPNGTETWYAHLGAVLVSTGAYVNQGDIIGSIGNTGRTHGPTGCHLHFEVRGGQNPFVR